MTTEPKPQYVHVTKPDDPLTPCDIIYNDGSRWTDEGFLTKREHFAAMAMQGIAKNFGQTESCQGPESIAYIAVQMADALIEALNKPVTTA